MLLYVSHAGFIFGSAKPVPVNPRRYRNYRRGDIIVSLAGIAANLALYVVCAGLFAGVGILGALSLTAPTGTATILQRMFFYGMFLNLVLACFNLIPLPPLDGSHVFYHLLPAQAGATYRRLYMLGFLPILLLVWLWPGAVDVLLWPARQLLHLALSLVGRFAVSEGAFPR